MIRTSRNPNSSTPIVAVTGYLKELSDPHHFDELIEKPATPSKLIDVLERQCTWKAPPQDRPMISDRKESFTARKSPLPHDSMGRISPSVERFMRGDKVSAQSSSGDNESVSTTGEWEGLGLKSGLGMETESLRLLPRPAPSLTQQETAPPRLQSHTIERIPSPLSTHVTTGAIENFSPPLPSPPEMAPLPPSITTTPLFSTPSADKSKSPLRIPSPNPRPLAFQMDLGIQDPSMSYAESESTPVEERARTTFGMIFPPSKEKTSPKFSASSSSPESKTKKRISFEKKKEKLERQQKEGLNVEDADADDEGSVCSEKRPSKSRSIGENLIAMVRRSAPEMRRTKSQDH